MIQQPLTLIDYARTRQLDPAQLLTHFTDNPDTLPEPQGEQAGQPTYDPDQLDHARGVTTLAAFATLREWDVADVRRWDKRQPDLWPDPVGELRTGQAGNPSKLYPLGALDLVAAAESVRRGREEQPEGLVTMDEFAAKMGVSPAMVKNKWRVQYKGIWPEPAGKRGRQHLYEEEKLMRVYRAARPGG
ncbi:hypothetical protein ACWFMI_25075 [Nocardiopsis terrae]|uniref:hypothetical protein n=1 Tax=Streptomyces sp. NPDC057554 TaxID=3350538 RepID=UPI0036BF333F